jgi:ABC-2 type transport system permease protein
MTYATIAVFISAAVATIAGVAFWGFNHVTTFSGSVVPPGEGLLLVFAANACYLIPMAAIVSIGVLLSTVTRNSAAAVVGTLAVTLILALITVIPGLQGAQPYLLTTEYNNWHGLLRTPTDLAPIWHSLWVCALYAVPSLAAAYLVFLRRDVAGG